MKIKMKLDQQFQHAPAFPQYFLTLTLMACLVLLLFPSFSLGVQKKLIAKTNSQKIFHSSQEFETLATLVTGSSEKTHYAIQKSKKIKSIYSIRITYPNKRIRRTSISRTIAMDLQSQILGIIWDSQYLSKNNTTMTSCQVVGELAVSLSKDAARICQEDLGNTQKMHKMGLELQSLAKN